MIGYYDARINTTPIIHGLIRSTDSLARAEYNLLKSSGRSGIAEEEITRSFFECKTSSKTKCEIFYLVKPPIPYFVNLVVP